MRFQVDNLVAGYSRIEVVHGISIEVPEDGRVGLFGPNGHGKTTLLRAISGLIERRSGTVRFGDMDLTGASSARMVEEGIVHVPQGSSLFPRMTVLEALTLGAYVGRAWGQRRRSLDKVLTIFPRLAERRSQRCSTLSGGERQMAAIGVGLMGCPRLLILDEPTLGLAPRIPLRARSGHPRNRRDRRQSHRRRSGHRNAVWPVPAPVPDRAGAGDA